MDKRTYGGHCFIQVPDSLKAQYLVRNRCFYTMKKLQNISEYGVGAMEPNFNIEKL